MAGESSPRKFEKASYICTWPKQNKPNHKEAQHKRDFFFCENLFKAVSRSLEMVAVFLDFLGLPSIWVRLKKTGAEKVLGLVLLNAVAKLGRGALPITDENP